jgi:hypothetical protein
MTAGKRKSPRDLTHGLGIAFVLEGKGDNPGTIAVPTAFSLWRRLDGGLVRRSRRLLSWNCLWFKLAFLGHGHAILVLTDGIANVSRGTSATSTSTAVPTAAVVAVAIARIVTIGRIAVEVAPIARAATTRTTPIVRRHQGKQATQRSAMPSTATTARAAGIATGVAIAAVCRAARFAARNVAIIVAIGNHGPSCRGICRANRTAGLSAGRTASLVASFAARARIATTAGTRTARTVAEDRLEQTTAGAGRHHAHEQTEK